MLRGQGGCHAHGLLMVGCLCTVLTAAARRNTKASGSTTPASQKHTARKLMLCTSWCHIMALSILAQIGYHHAARSPEPAMISA